MKNVKPFARLLSIVCVAALLAPVVAEAAPHKVCHWERHGHHPRARVCHWVR